MAEANESAKVGIGQAGGNERRSGVAVFGPFFFGAKKDGETKPFQRNEFLMVFLGEQKSFFFFFFFFFFSFFLGSLELFSVYFCCN